MLSGVPLTTTEQRFRLRVWLQQLGKNPLQLQQHEREQGGLYPLYPV